MAERRPTMMDPPVENLLRRVDSKFTLVTLAAKRGRELNGAEGPGVMAEADR